MIELQLDKLLNDRGITAYALAKQTGLHQSVISKLKHNESRALRLDVLDRVCEALNCEPGELIVRIPNKKPGKK